jgi:tRNA G26 N,N-dimethylase Trm1
MSRKWIVSGASGTRKAMEDFSFELVCASCLETRGVLDSERLPEACPNCGARDTWKGPFALPRFQRDAEQLAESPFYLGASRANAKP